jgi:hypothetical protein
MNSCGRKTFHLESGVNDTGCRISNLNGVCMTLDVTSLDNIAFWRRLVDQV